jgi:succinate dehydrogenase hydrophobic anchor subunit
MINLEQYGPSPASGAEFCRFWSAHVDALERHLSANTWALAASAVVLIVYPIAHMVIPAALHGIVPEMVRTVLNLI